MKFTHDGGAVTLSASRVPRTDVGQPSAAWPGRSLPLADSEFSEFLKISVADSGIGISPEGLEVLFQPFSQIDTGLARRFEGTGLGLAMVKLLAELHGGAVAAESAAGEGSASLSGCPFATPAEDAVAAARAPVLPRVERRPARRIALVVEDDVQSAELIRLQLEAQGFAVMHAVVGRGGARARRADRRCRSSRSTSCCPTWTGGSSSGRIKQVPALVHIPVVIISIVADRSRGFALGAAAIMQKPVSRQELSEALRRARAHASPAWPDAQVLVADDDPHAVELVAVRMSSWR